MIDKSRSVSAQIAADVFACNDQAVMDTIVEFVQQVASAIGTAVSGFASDDAPLVAAVAKMAADSLYEQLEPRAKGLADSTVALLRPHLTLISAHVPYDAGNKEADYDNN